MVSCGCVVDVRVVCVVCLFVSVLCGVVSVEYWVKRVGT